MTQNFEKLLVRDAMVPLDQYPSVPRSCTLKQAVEIISKAIIQQGDSSSLPRNILVFDEENRLVGWIRRRDILRALEPRYLVQQPLYYRKKLFDVKIDPNLSELSYDHVLKGLREQAKRTVGDIMRPIVETVDVNDHIIKVIYTLVEHNLSFLPVLDRHKVVGVIRTVDVLREVARVLLEPED
jgi:CBS domain-containing protein